MAVIVLSASIMFIVAVAKSISDSQTAVPDTSTSTAAEEHEHTFSEAWIMNVDYHWHESTCGHDVIKDKAQHIDDEGVILEPATENEHGRFRYTCVICTHFRDIILHYYKDVETDIIIVSGDNKGDKLIKNLCSVCGLENPLAFRSEHVYSEEWQTDENFHWHNSTCVHEVTTEKQPHTFVDGFCSVCHRPQDEEELDEE